MAYKAKLTLSERRQQINTYGDEPEAASDLTVQSAFASALSWYTRCSTPEERTDWIAHQLRARGIDSKQIETVLHSSKLTASLGSIARMLSRDCMLPDGTEQRWLAQIEACSEVRDSNVVEFAKKLGPAAHNRAKVRRMAADLDEIMDAVWTRKAKTKDIKFFELFEKLSVKPKQATMLFNIFKPQLDEIRDPEIPHCKERPLLEEYLDTLVKSLKVWTKKVDGEELSIEPKKRGRKVIGGRAGKAATTRNLKFKLQDEETKMVSVDPRQILGSSIVVLYNTKYKYLYVLRAADADGLSVKGTTIINVDEKASEAKRAGRHVESIKQMANSSKTQIAKLVASISSVNIEVRTRVSDEVIIVRALK
jgi:hypothetical protein